MRTWLLIFIDNNNTVSSITLVVIRHAFKMVEMKAMMEILDGVYLSESGYLPFRSVN